MKMILSHNCFLTSVVCNHGDIPVCVCVCVCVCVFVCSKHREATDIGVIYDIKTLVDVSVGENQGWR